MYNDEEKDYCLISKEILFLLEWLLMQDMQTIEKILKKSWKNGLEKFIKVKNKEEFTIDQAGSQKIIFYFFSFLENILKKLENKKQKKSSKKNKSKVHVKEDEATAKLLEVFENSQLSLEASHKKKRKNSIKKNTEKTDLETNTYKKFLENWNPKKSFSE